ncbi:MAG TPA: hypothetical protein VN317_06205, partial [Candidatus Methanoperedens sp.]|nr:hypothetical protein [Candidatus Methanoperedens sp.]
MKAGGHGRGDAFTALAVGALAAAPYLLRGGLQTFIAFDDDKHILENAPVLAGLTASGLRWALTTFHTGNWHPLTWLSHMLDVSLFG